MMIEIEKCVIDALRDAYDWIANLRQPKGQEVIFDVVNLMLDIERRAQKQAARDNRPAAPGWAKPSWQSLYFTDDEDEKAGDLAQRAIDAREGGEEYIRARLGIPIVDDDEIALARSIRDVFTALLPVNTRAKDWELMQRIAEKTDSERTIARALGIHHSAVSKMKSRQGRAAEIWNAMCPFVVPETAAKAA